ncbi:ABC transporter ATP-binding protein [Streptomyces solincola]|uniref:ABC transporter ATP-binding protein n=1 Tax=Streptomyces solincola TaxID=2100817 RepID=A0A2S9PQW3_9ACTN|nr:ATP-binding cassette domain-containing protein [Streptomyces solincola]PRH76804.1 ABC transporter ATP-binding protein [Streptomyces solincola]
MLQAIGLTSTRRGDLPLAVDDVTFEARPGEVTVLLGPRGCGGTTALRMMLGLEPGRGITYFRGRQLHRVAHPAREVGVLLGDVPGHPARTVRGQLRMLCAAVGVPASRADDMLDIVGLSALRGQRLGSLSLGMDRRLGVATALLGDPHTLLLDQPSAGLAARDAHWLHGLLRAHADHGGTVLYTTADSREAARQADHVVTLERGRLTADQDAAAFARTRPRPRVSVRTPHAARLAVIVRREARAAQRSVEVVAEPGGRLSVYGADCASVGEAAFRHGVLLHRLAHEEGDCEKADGAEGEGAEGYGADREGVEGTNGPREEGQKTDEGPTATRADVPLPAVTASASAAASATVSAPRAGDGARPLVALPVGRSAVGGHTGGKAAAPVPQRRARRGPMRPVRYELRRMAGVPSTAVTLAVGLIASVAGAVLLARFQGVPLTTALAAWPEVLPLPPAALAAGLLGALSFGDEYRHPALCTGRGIVPRRVGLLLAKLLVTAGAAVLTATAAALADFGALRLVYGAEAVTVPGNWPVLVATWTALCVGCGWAGLLAAGVFRVTAAGVAAVLAVPVVVAPLMQWAFVGRSVRSLGGLPGRLRELLWPRWPFDTDTALLAVARTTAQPVGAAMVLSLAVLTCAYLLTGRRRGARW